ncbi:hypothetical protein BGX28_007808 [Mortierella sp. GBA30]|nr:hypothetical protein BGX28_007808 [Mortierella sp. GBA30]
MSTQTPQGRPSSSSSSPTSPVLNVNVNFKHSANEAFYSEPNFPLAESKKKGSFLPSPTLESTMLDPAPDTSTSTPAAKQDQDASGAKDTVAAPVTSAAAATPTITPAAATSTVPAPAPVVATNATATATAPAPVVAADATAPSAPTAALAQVSGTPIPIAANPTSPILTPAQPTVALTFSTTVVDDIIVDEVGTSIAEADRKDDTKEVEVSSNTASAEDTPKENGVQPMDVDEHKIQRKQIEELLMLNANLKAHLEDTLQEKQSVDDELNRTRGAYYDLNRHFVDLQQKLAKRESDYEVMSKNYLEHVRLIRPTDDDHSTIMDRLTQLKASIEHLIRKAQGGRSVNLQRELAIEHIKGKGLLEGFPVPEDKLEAYHLNLFMESVVMSTLVSHFFDKPLCCIFDYNKGFKEIYDWMFTRNEKLAVRFRQQLCVMVAQDPATKARQDGEVSETANALSELISKVYANTTELAKVRDICNKAFELAIAMTGLESVISPVTIPLGTPFDEDNMGTSLKSNPEGKVALVIFPAFQDKECAFDVRPKVWCY